jgi:hypothetical protein
LSLSGGTLCLGPGAMLTIRCAVADRFALGRTFDGANPRLIGPRFRLSVAASCAATTTRTFGGSFRPWPASPPSKVAAIHVLPFILPRPKRLLPARSFDKDVRVGCIDASRRPRQYQSNCVTNIRTSKDYQALCMQQSRVGGLSLGDVLFSRRMCAGKSAYGDWH